MPSLNAKINQDNQTFTKVSKDSNFDTGAGKKLSLFGDLAIENDIFAVNNGNQSSSFIDYEFLSRNVASPQGSDPSIINIGSSTIGPLVTTNIQSENNFIGQYETGQFITTAANVEISFNADEASSDTISPVQNKLELTTDGSFLIGGISNLSSGPFLPLALSSYTNLGIVAKTINNSTDKILDKNKINTSDYVGTLGVTTVALPEANAGDIIVYEQSLPYAGTNALTFICDGTDVFATGSVAPNPTGLAWAESDASQTQLEFKPIGASSNYFDAKSYIEFQCVKQINNIGTWFVNIIAIPGNTNTTGEFKWLPP